MITKTTKATIVEAMMPCLIPHSPNGGTAGKSGLNIGGTTIVSGQITEVVISHCFQPRASSDSAFAVQTRTRYLDENEIDLRARTHRQSGR
jgi:hypothetical protein